MDLRRLRLFLAVVDGGGMTRAAESEHVSQPSVSQHLRVLLDAGLVTVRQEGRRRIYRASPEGLARVRAEVERYWQAAVAQMKDDLEGREPPSTSRGGGKGRRR